MLSNAVGFMFQFFKARAIVQIGITVHSYNYLSAHIPAGVMRKIKVVSATDKTETAIHTLALMEC